LKYIWYCLTAKRQLSNNFHYQFVNDFITNVVRGKDPVDYDGIEKNYKNLRYDTTILNVQDLGAGSVSGRGQIRQVSQLVRHSSIGLKYGRLLSRLVHSIKPFTIIELGTGAGFSTMYMALASDKCKIYSIEGSPEIADLAGGNIKSLGLKNTEIIAGSFNDILPAVLQKIQHPLFIFIDGDHRGENLIGYFETILPFTTENTVVVLDDIRWSLSMEKAWKKIVKRTEVSVSIDLFRMGILFLEKNINKQHFIVKF
jgi:predicted O-methyltransferase YrrM